MYERLKRLYNTGQLDVAGLQRAVGLGWITQEQAEEIMGAITPEE